MALVLKLASLDLIRLHRLGWRDPFQGLNAGHLIATHAMPTQAVEQRGIGIDGTDGLNLLAKGDRVNRLGFRIQPVATAMRLEIGLALKNARLNGLKSRAPALV